MNNPLYDKETPKNGWYIKKKGFAKADLTATRSVVS